MNKLLLTILICLFCACSAQSAVTISSVSQTNGVITIQGSGFGSKSPAAPLLWEDFENGTNGATLSNGWSSYYSGAKYSSTLSHSGTLSAYNFVEYGGKTGFDTSYTIFPSGQTKLYISYFFRHTGTSYTAGVDKQWRLRKGPDPYQSAYDGQVTLSDGYMFYNAGSGSIYPDPDEGTARKFSSAVLGINSWVRHDIEAIHSTPNASNGKYKLTVGSEVKTYANISTRASSTTVWNTFLLPLMYDHSPINLDPGEYHHIYVDDVYIDNTPARIELCTGSSWASKGTCVPEIPTVWSDTSVTADINTAVLSGYLYIVDSSGVVNSTGYAASFDGSFVPDPDPDPDPIPGLCGPANGGTFETLTSIDPDLCTEGAVSLWNLGATTASWRCDGQFGGVPDDCAATITGEPVEPPPAGNVTITPGSSTLELSPATLNNFPYTVPFILE